MNFVINLHKKKLIKMEVEKMKNFFFPNYEKMMPTTKSKMFISNTKGLKGSA